MDSFLTSEEKDEDDNLLHESNYTFRTDEHPELEQLTEIWPEYSEVTLEMLPSSLLHRSEDKTVAASRLSLQLKSKKTKKKQTVSSGIVNELPVIVEPLIPIRITSPFEATSGVTYHKDFIRCLPIHLAKYVFGFLDQNSLQNCMLVSRHWAYLGKEFTRDKLAIQCIFDEIRKLQKIGTTTKLKTVEKIKKEMEKKMHKETHREIKQDKKSRKHKGKVKETALEACIRQLENKEVHISKNLFKKKTDSKILQATAPHNINTAYAKICQIPVPRIDEKGFTIPTQNLKKKIGLAASYIGIHTDMVQMEERNVYCGPYNIIVIKQLTDVARVIHYDGGQWIAMASGDRRIRFLDINHSKDVPHSLSGHAGAIKAVILCEEQGFLLSGSYDLTIRKWNLKTATCVTMYRGHTGFITCLSLHENMLVSGSTDCHAKVWDLQKGTCFHTFKQDKSILSVAISATYVMSGNEKGVIHVWNIKPPSLVKVLTGHINSITCMFFDQWHLISGSKDKCIKVWSMMGKFSDCLMTFKHPQEVLCLQFVYLRVISGCRDGKIRIFDLLNGICLRMMRATGHGDPVLSIHIAGNRMVINTMSSVVKFQFEDIVWDYKAKASILDASTPHDKFKMAPLRKQPYSYVRAQRMRRIDSTNEKIYHRQEKFSKDGLFHHARFLSARCMKAAQRIQSDSMKALSLRESQYRDHSASYSLQSEFDLKPPSAYMSSSEMLTQKHLKQDAHSRILYGERPKSLSAASRFLSVSEQSALKQIKRHKLYKPKTVDQIYLTVNAIHNYLRYDETSINTLYNNSLSEDWGQLLCPFEDTAKKGSDTAIKKATVKISDSVDAVGLRNDCIDVKTLMAPFELKMQKFKEEDKFSGLDTKCFVTKPMIKRSKSAVAFVDSVKFRRAKGRPQSAVEEINKSMSSRTTSFNNGSRTKAFVLTDSATTTIEPKHKLQHIVDINPYRNNSGFTLSTMTQQKEYAEKIAKDHNGQQQRTSNSHN